MTAALRSSRLRPYRRYWGMPPRRWLLGGVAALAATGCIPTPAPEPTTTTAKPPVTTAKPTPTTAKPTTTTAKPTTTTAKPTTTTGAAATGSIGDRVWADANGNGIQESGEAGLAGITVSAYRVSGATRSLYSQKSTVNGWFRFPNLTVGTCVSLEIALPPGYAFSPAGKGTETTDSDVNASGVTPTYCAVAGDNSDYDIGLKPAQADNPPATTVPTPTTAAPTTVPPTTAPPTTSAPTTAPPTTSGTSTPAGWKLFWADDFNGSALDTSKWSVDNNSYLAGNNELECYKTDNVKVNSGNLVIEARKEGVSCGSTAFQPYSSGMIRTSGKFSTAYGRFEMRARFPKGKGLWPAFWTTSQNYPYGGNGRSGELDIVEVIGSKPNVVVGTAHWAYNGCGWGCSRYGYEYTMPGGDTADGFHTYAMEWEPGRIAWYLDGVKYYELGNNGAYKWGSQATNLSKSTDYTSNPLAAYPAPFDASNPQQLIVNLAVGGTWPGSPDSATPFPSQMQVDYVRVFKRP